MKKFLSFFLAVFMVMSTIIAVPTSVSAEETNGVVKKINELSDLLVGKYFTANQDACTCADGCSNCNLRNIIGEEPNVTTWLEELFGFRDIDVDTQIPMQYRPYSGKWGSRSGYSCYAFANFAFWYIFSTSNTSKATYECALAYGNFDYATISAYAKPGDIIRIERIIAPADGKEDFRGTGHSVIFISCDKNGVTVLDDNAGYNSNNLTSKARDKVAVHTISYSTYSSRKIAITRAANYDEIAGASSETSTTYTISYNANGGSGAPAAQTKTHGVALTLSSTVPTRDGYTFKGWATSSTGAVAYAPGASFTANANTVLYAVWEVDSTQSCTGYKTQYRYYHYTDGNGNYSVCGGMNIENGKWTSSYREDTGWLDAPLELVSSSATSYNHTVQTYCAKHGCIDESWKGGKYVDAAGVSWYREETRTVPNEYTVFFDVIGGTTSTLSKTVAYNSTYGTLPTPTRPGFTFDGWYTAESGGTKVTSSSVVSITTDQTLYAHWIVIPIEGLSFDKKNRRCFYWR